MSYTQAYNNDSRWRKGWGFGHQGTCREYKKNGDNNFGRFNGVQDDFQTQIECYLR